MDITFHIGEGRFNYRVCAIFLTKTKCSLCEMNAPPTTTCPAAG